MNGARLRGKEGHRLKEGDTLTLGVAEGNAPPNQYTVGFHRIVVCHSRLGKAAKLTVVAMCKACGVHVAKEWTSNATHLVVSVGQCTPTTLQALLACKPVVLPSWLVALWGVLEGIIFGREAVGEVFMPCATRIFLLSFPSLSFSIFLSLSFFLLFLCRD